MMRRISIAISIAVLAALALASPARAQSGFAGRSATVGRPAPGRPAPRGGRGSFGYARHTRSGFGFRRGGWGSGLGWGWNYFPDYYDRGEEYARPDYEPPPLPAQQAMFEPPQPEKIIQPILIERQGEGWVRISGYKEAQVSGQAAPMKVELANAPAVHLATTPPAHVIAQTTSELPPAVLVFRDGHQEEIKSYTIIGKVLYAKADYWSSGEWTRKIEIANLDVPATLKLNQDHGYLFRLPSNPQEVVIRP